MSGKGGVCGGCGGAEYDRFKGIGTLHPLIAAISTPAFRPVIVSVQIRRGKAGAPRGAAPLAGQAM